ncbi:MAG: peptidylprolyl isomerase [Haliea sp.]|nr:peptidylprolyl isomerase [Haliea sp.]|tara:strand:- start:26576 stop:27151 length:576 start_codon:yes stop_codon:yes gene_type:complete
MRRRILLGLLLLTSLSLPTHASETSQPYPLVVIRTDEGDITLRLLPDKAPITVANFLDYVEAGHYNGTIFHRVIPDFMIQGGGLLPDMSEKPTGTPIQNESRNRLHNTRGTIAMARMNDPDSATAQFFINQRDNLQLDWTPGREGYTVFGEVVAGMSIVDYIATSPTAEVEGHANVPVEPVIIRSIERVGL